MTFDDIRAVIGTTPYMAVDEGWELYQFILKHRPNDILELGHAHGASSLYMVAALDEMGEGRVETVDLTSSRDRHPNIEELLTRAGLADRVIVHREQSSYTWFLKKKIEAQTEGDACIPCYDFCFIDGPKNWTIDGAAFFLVDKLLRPGGWILFDDYGWSHGRHPERTATDGISVRGLSPEEIAEPQIAAVFRLLVMQHPGYANFLLQDGWWAWAQKRSGGRRSLAIGQKAMDRSGRLRQDDPT